ncbi:MAG: AAA family ATPase [Flavobacteriaceae bacterium]|nr:AAA family ATPase [Flavobacteriaceae bacterium]
MAININTTELRIILENTPIEQNIMLVGKHGIGKSKIITDYFAEQQIKVITLFLGQMSDPGDLIGLPHKNEETGKTDFLPPYWFPVDNKPIVLFLDELNRARPEILQTVMDLTLNRTLAGKKLPQGSRIISAVNDGEEYQLTDLDPALVSRFNIYNFVPTVAEWLLWATRKGINRLVIKFIEENPMCLDAVTIEEGLEKSPDRRAWEKVSDILKEELQLDKLQMKKLFAGIIGVEIASKFVESFAGTKLISADELMRNFKKYLPQLKKYDITEIAIINESIFRFLESKNYQNSEEEIVKANLVGFVNWLSKLKSKEYMAHFISIFEHSVYPQANLFIISETSDLYKKIMQFIQDL